MCLIDYTQPLWNISTGNWTRIFCVTGRDTKPLYYRDLHSKVNRSWLFKIWWLLKEPFVFVFLLIKKPASPTHEITTIGISEQVRCNDLKRMKMKDCVKSRWLSFCRENPTGPILRTCTNRTRIYNSRNVLVSILVLSAQHCVALPTSYVKEYRMLQINWRIWRTLKFAYVDSY